MNLIIQDGLCNDKENRAAAGMESIGKAKHPEVLKPPLLKTRSKQKKSPASCGAGGFFKTERIEKQSGNRSNRPF